LITSCSSVPSLASSTRALAYFTVQITCPPILKSPNPSRGSLVTYLLYKLNRSGEKQHHCLNPLPVFTLCISQWSSHALTLIHVQFDDSLCICRYLFPLGSSLIWSIVPSQMPVNEANTQFLIDFHSLF
jgi:hypothetical protein